MRVQLGRSRLRARRLRPAWLGLWAVSAVLVGSGLGSFAAGPTVPGRASPDVRLVPLDTPEPTRLVPGSALRSIAVAPERAEQLLGAALGWSRSVTAPGPDSQMTARECLLADPVGTRGAYGQDWTAFSKTTVQPAEADDSTQVVLAVGLYRSEGKARGAFSALVSAMGDCGGKSVTETTALGAELALSFETDQAETDSIQWRSQQRDAAATGSRERGCAYDARVRRNAFLEVMVCVSGTEAKGAKEVADALEQALPS